MDAKLTAGEWHGRLLECRYESGQPRGREATWGLRYTAWCHRSTGGDPHSDEAVRPQRRDRASPRARAYIWYTCVALSSERGYENRGLAVQAIPWPRIYTLKYLKEDTIFIMDST